MSNLSTNLQARRTMRRARVFTSLLVLSSIGLVGNTQADPANVPLVDPGFEADGTGVASPIGWQSAGNVDADFTEGGGHSGSFRLSHFSPNAYSVGTFQTAN